MIKKTINYIDYNGNKREEDFYFNLTKAELAEMQVSEDGGFDVYLKKILNEKNAKEIIKIFKTIIMKSYGEKSEDGKRFIKSDDISTAFIQTEAYSELFIEVTSNPEKANEFILGMLPTEIREEIIKSSNK